MRRNGEKDKMRLLGIDIGGTFIKYALISENKVVDSGKKPSNAKFGAEKLLETLFAVIDEFVCGFDGIAVSTAGVVGKNGEIVYANDNIPRYTGVKLKEILKNKYGVEVSVMNDAAAMAYSLKTELNDYFFIAVGTGVAGGYVSGGKLFTGGGGFAGQLGYLTALNGKRADTEASSKGLSQLCGKPCEEVFKDAKKGDETTLLLLKKWAKELYNVIKAAVVFYNPETVVIGGGISAQGDFLINLVKAAADEDESPYSKSYKIICAPSENFQAVIGAIKYFTENCDE